jgi:ribonucleoside-diphosphate reductase alpha chain
LQATYTTFPYLGRTTELIAKRDALLGVGICGMMDNPSISLDPDVQRKAAACVRLVNQKWADALGIKEAARLTTIKPGGTAPLELGGVGSGIHPHHARRYFRRVIANKNEPVAQFFKKRNPHMVEEKPDGDWCLVFPVEAPPDAVTVKNMSAQDLLTAAILTKKAWINEGSKDPLERSPGLTHNVSLTVHFRPEEWEGIVDQIIKDKDHITAMSFLPVTSDKRYPYAPREEVTTAEDEVKWVELISKYRSVRYDLMREDGDNTVVRQEAACTGGTCEIIHVDSHDTDIPGTVMLFQDEYRYGGLLIGPPDDFSWRGGALLEDAAPGDLVYCGDPKDPLTRWYLVKDGPYRSSAGNIFVHASIVATSEMIDLLYRTYEDGRSQENAGHQHER